jgi:hypothetical protein
MKIYLLEMVVMQRTSRDVLRDLNISIKCENEPLQHVLDLIDENGNIEEFEQILKQQIVLKSMNINPFLCRLL